MKRAALVLVAAAALPVAAAAQTPVDQTRPAAADATVSIENLAGSTKVTGWDRLEVRVKGTVCSGCELNLDGNDKRVRVEVESSHLNAMAAKSDIEVSVPAGSLVKVEGFNATISIAGVNGPVRAETVNGSITHAGGSKDVQLQSVNGAVESSRAAGRVHVEAVNGPVTVRDASGELEASTVNGKLVVSGGSFTRAHLEAVGGGIRFESAVAPKGSLGVETVSGPVDLFFPAGADADFTVTTFSGSVTNELGPAAQKKDEFSPEKELVFTTGKGGTRVSVETLSGAISIHKKP
ncbi:MAG TPA: DUF4097 family beta strand repeat-containing protein [Vicinamibacteria bacterium]|nr:DUF4097 family beta strand repeat-containing protein [Vicinamibacteria bacterium]